MTYEISPYSSYDNYTISCQTKNVSSIIDKLIRLSAKITEYFAGDIHYDIAEYLDAVLCGTNYEILLLFRENGIVSKSLIGNTVKNFETWTMYSQAWKLSWDAENECGKLYRVSIKCKSED